MKTFECGRCGAKTHKPDTMNIVMCVIAECRGVMTPLTTEIDEGAEVTLDCGVKPRCFLCESLKLESRTPLMAATKGTFICYDCIETLHETMTSEKKGEKLKLPKGV
jgi:hypothetical protein